MTNIGKHIKFVTGLFRLVFKSIKSFCTDVKWHYQLTYDLFGVVFNYWTERFNRQFKYYDSLPERIISPEEKIERDAKITTRSLIKYDTGPGPVIFYNDKLFSEGEPAKAFIRDRKLLKTELQKMSEQFKSDPS